MRKIFDKGTDEENIKRAKNWESKLLRKIDAKSREDWLNQHNGDGKFLCKGHSKETRKKMSLAANNRPPISEQTRKKMSEVQRGKPKLNMRGTNHPNFGKARSQETKDKIRKSLIGIAVSEHTRKKLSEAKQGRRFSEEHKRNISLALRRHQEVNNHES